ncbi:MAG: hypothetical protein HC880_20460 [Bacteroidia bacterium]|nr:hypothetical protein [Bacteroidia bacterium]
MAATDAQLEEAIDKMFALRQEELDWKKMKEQLINIISIRQMAELVPLRAGVFPDTHPDPTPQIILIGRLVE